SRRCAICWRRNRRRKVLSSAAGSVRRSAGSHARELRDGCGCPPPADCCQLLYDSPMRLALAAALLLTCAGTGWAKDPVYRLSIGDPARKDKDAAVTLDAITDTATGETIAPAELGARLAKARLVLVGETHTSVESHRVELQVIKALADAGRHVTVALEMFPYPSQPALDAWNQGAESEA